ncbi:cobaltochelatase CobT-related protein [Halomonas salinarum]|uniref:cobaltochelatase CobT-related protein n=1 Tax=Halomonas salinarum TaxID=1158993 RepID=UPI00143C4705|nr:hypothetical protein [Halomonas salinarum]
MPALSTDTSRCEELAAAWERTYAAGREVPHHLPLLTLWDVPTRSTADALAAWRRWHGTSQEERFSDEQRPWYDALERARVETLASAKLPGMASNLAELVNSDNEGGAKEELYRIARLVFTGKRPTQLALLAPPASSDESSWLAHLMKSLPSRKRQASVTIAKADISEHQLMEALSGAIEHLDDDIAFTDCLVELIDKLAPLNPTTTSYSSEPQSISAETRGKNEQDREDEAGDMEKGRPNRRSLAEELEERDDKRQGYAVFSRQWDEEQPASRWATEDDAVALCQLDTIDRRRVRHLAHRLQRKLMSARQRHWQFDQEEGRLDGRRLARLIGDTPTRRVFRYEQTSPLTDACVTLLVDQSGSMSSRRRHMAALAIDLAVHTLEICQIRCEVLGFTTRYTADNPLVEQWRLQDLASPPGRLNAIRHIIYKSVDQPWRRVRPQLGLLLRESPGHENIDGEALHWAATRLSRQPEPHKILVVLSDGAPYDKVTAQANGRDFLERHLRHVISEVECSPIHLAAIGTGQDVGRFYRQVMTVRQPDEVANRLFEQLGELLTTRRSS